MIAVLTAFLIGSASAAGHGAVLEDVPDRLSFFENPQFSVLVVSVLEATIEDGTNGAPPEGRFRVEEVLRGKYVQPGEHPYRMLSPRGPESFDENRQLKPEWDAMPLSGPGTGDELIVIAYVWQHTLQDDPTIMLQGPLIRSTADNRSIVAERLAHDSPLQIPLMLLIIALPAFALAALLMPWRADRSGGWPAAVRKLPLVLPPGALVLYAVYESLMSGYYDIRVDLLLVWPALGMGGVVWLVGLARMRRGTRIPRPEAS